MNMVIVVLGAIAVIALLAYKFDWIKFGVGPTGISGEGGSGSGKAVSSAASSGGGDAAPGDPGAAPGPASAARTYSADVKDSPGSQVIVGDGNTQIRSDR